MDTVVANRILGGPESRKKLNRKLRRAVKAINAFDTAKATNILQSAHQQITQINQNPETQIQIRTAFNATVRNQIAAFAPVQPRQLTAREALEERKQIEAAETSNNLLHEVVSAIHKAESKTTFRPDKITLTPKAYANLITGINPYSGWFPTAMDDDNFPSPYRTANNPGKLFGIDLEIGKKCQVSLNPIHEFYAVPGGEFGTEIHAREIVLRQEICFPIGAIFEMFRGYIITRKTRGQLINPNEVAKNEMVAIDTLREVISEREYRRYLNYGFILVQGKSGATYQIFRNQSHTKVWKGGKLIEEVCVRIKDSKVPPTDNVIAFKTMIEIDEEEFKKAGNVYKMAKAA